MKVAGEVLMNTLALESFDSSSYHVQGQDLQGLQSTKRLPWEPRGGRRFGHDVQPSEADRSPDT